MEVIPKSIATALVAAQAAVKPVEKDSTNAHHKYKYASSDDLVHEARRAMTSVGLALSRVGWSEQPVTEHAPARLVVQYALTSKDGESWMLAPVSVPVLPAAGRPEDKAEAAALTYSHGYVVLGLLQMARVDENDVDARNDGDRGAWQPKQRETHPERLSDCKSGPQVKAWCEANRAKLSKCSDEEVATWRERLEHTAEALGIKAAEVLGWVGWR